MSRQNEDELTFFERILAVVLAVFFVIVVTAVAMLCRGLMAAGVVYVVLYVIAPEWASTLAGVAAAVAAASVFFTGGHIAVDAGRRARR